MFALFCLTFIVPLKVKGVTQSSNLILISALCFTRVASLQSSVWLCEISLG